MPDFAWSDKFEREGFKVFDVYAERSLGAIKKKFDQYRKFFEDVEGLYPRSKRFTAEHKRLDILNQKLRQANYLIDQMLATTSPQSGQELTGQLAGLAIEIEDDFKFFSKSGEISDKLRAKIEAIEKKSGTTAAGIAKTGTLIKARMHKLVAIEANLMQRFKSASPTAHGLLTDLGRGVMHSTLGPVSSLAEQAINIVGEVLSSHRERKLQTERDAFTGAMFDGGSPGAFSKAYGYFHPTGRAKVDPGYQDREPNKPTSTNRQGGQPAAAFAFAAPLAGASRQPDLLQLSLFSFFNGPAYRAKWTKELLETVGGQAKRGYDFGSAAGGENKQSLVGSALEGLGLGQLFKSLKGSIGKLAGAVGKFALAGLALYEAYKFLRIELHTLKYRQEMGRVATDIKQHGLMAGLGNEFNLGTQAVFNTSKPTFGQKLATAASGLPVFALWEKFGGPSVDDMARSWYYGAMNFRNKVMLPQPATIPSVSAAISQPRNNLTGRVPVDAVTSEAASSNDESIGKLHGALLAIMEEIKKSNRRETWTPSSGFDAYNVRDPLLDALNSGILGVK